MSLFGSDSDGEVDLDDKMDRTLRREKPTGLHHFTSMIPMDLQSTLCASLSLHIFSSTTNQSMLFCSASTPFPSFLTPLTDTLAVQLLDKIPTDLYAALFDSSSARQAIFNLYKAGEGITSHVDLLTRFEDGIVGVSLASTTVMDFTRPGYATYSIVVKPGDVYVLSKEARYDWLHGIAARKEDLIDGVNVCRRLRMSITLRRMKDGGDVVGE